MKSKQEIFDTVVNHLHKQGKPAEVGNTCRYRTEDGLMCAVGCLIPDDKYKPEMEGHVAYDILRILPPEVAEHIEMLDDLQWIHDSWTEACNGQPPSFDYIAYELSITADNHDVTFNDPRK